jgi:CRISPR-associated protein Csx14
MRKILIATLGETPQVVTEAIDALKEIKGIEINEVVTVSTKGWKVDIAQELLREDIDRNYGNKIVYYNRPTDFEDVDDQWANIGFMKIVCSVLLHYKGSERYVSIAGGRKTMSALMTLAVQMYGANGLYHVLVDEKDISANVDVDYLTGDLDEEAKRRIFHPPTNKLKLIELPFISLFPYISEFLKVLSGEKPEDLTPEKILLETGLVKKDKSKVAITPLGSQVKQLIEEIQLLPLPSPLRPNEKKIHLSDHHGKKYLEPIAKRLVLCPWVTEIVSDEFHKRQQGKIIPQEDGSVMVVTQSDAGYTLILKTTSSNKAQAERLVKEVERYL